MKNNTWLNSLGKKDFGIINEALEALKNPEKMYKLIGLNGHNNLDITKEFLLSGFNKCHVGVIDFEDNYIKYDNIYLNDEDIEFHSGCVKRIVEEKGLNISFFEAILLIALNIFREKRMEFVIVKKNVEATEQLTYDLNICHEYDESIKNSISFSKENTPNTISSKEVFLYNCEMCSFNYEKKDFDINMIGSYNAYYACLAMWCINHFLSTKISKLKKAIDDTICIGKMERVNINPRVILNIIENNYDIENVKYVVEKNYAHKKVIFLVEKEFNLLDEEIITSEESLKNSIRMAKTNDVIFILGSKENIKKTRFLFRK